ncbi:MAG: DsbA family oxidoreductase [Oceanospirillaceae bacterium]|nr:DsbA family oxidoreductase [Oceanospirillaceae bacterium]
MNNPKPPPLKIEMVHDLVCSWCPIAYHNLETAIDNLNMAVDFHFLAFELNPNMGTSGELIAAYFNRQFGWDPHKLFSYQKSLVATAAKSGVTIDFSKRKFYYNTHRAHLLMHWAQSINKHIGLYERLMRAYFSEGLDISNLSVLLNIAEDAGLERREASAALSSKQLENALEVKKQGYKAFNINGTPAFILNETELVSGSNSVDFFENVLQQYQQTQPLPNNI